MGGTECDDDTGTSGTCAMWAGEEGYWVFWGGGVILIFHPFSVKKEKSPRVSDGQCDTKLRAATLL